MIVKKIIDVKNGGDAKLNMLNSGEIPFEEMYPDKNKQM